MPKQNSTTVIVKRLPVKHHSVPAYWQGQSQRKHDWPRTYGNGYNGSNVKPANQQSKSQ